MLYSNITPAIKHNNPAVGAYCIRPDWAHSSAPLQIDMINCRRNNRNEIMRLAEHIYRTASSIRGPLLFLERVFSARSGEVVRIGYPDGSVTDGEVLKIDGRTVLVQAYGETRGLDLDVTVAFTDAVKQVKQGS